MYRLCYGPLPLEEASSFLFQSYARGETELEMQGSPISFVFLDFIPPPPVVPACCFVLYIYPSSCPELRWEVSSTYSSTSTDV